MENGGGERSWKWNKETCYQQQYIFIIAIATCCTQPVKRRWPGSGRGNYASQWCVGFSLAETGRKCLHISLRGNSYANEPEANLKHLRFVSVFYFSFISHVRAGRSGLRKRHWTELIAHRNSPDQIIIRDRPTHFLAENAYIVNERRRVIKNLHDTVEVACISCTYAHSRKHRILQQGFVPFQCLPLSILTTFLLLSLNPVTY